MMNIPQLQREIRICSYGAATLPLAEFAWLERMFPGNGNEFSLVIFKTKK